MLLLAPGPVPIEHDIASIGAIEMLPYFRGRDFANLMINLTEDAKVLFDTKATPLTITASGTGLMEMAIVNLLNPKDSVVVINGGNFGKKWVNMCKAFELRVLDFSVELGRSPDLAMLAHSIPSDAKALLINAHETSTGYLYDLCAIGEICRSRNLLYIVDGVSSIGADEYHMDEWGIDCSMVSTQKALGAMPGLGFIAFSDRAIERIHEVKRPRCYFDALDYLANIKRGMTPFTPAMVAILQIREVLNKIKQNGMSQLIDRHKKLADAFRSVFLNHPDFSIFPERPSNALTALRLPKWISASTLIETLRDKLDWWLAPNPTKSEEYIRVSHMGALDIGIMKEVGETILDIAMSFRPK